MAKRSLVSLAPSFISPFSTTVIRSADGTRRPRTLAWTWHWGAPDEAIRGMGAATGRDCCDADQRQPSPSGSRLLPSHRLSADRRPVHEVPCLRAPNKDPTVTPGEPKMKITNSTKCCRQPCRPRLTDEECRVLALCADS